MTDKEREKLEDIIIAILLHQTDIQHCSNGRQLHFKLTSRKAPILLDYIHRYNLTNEFQFDSDTTEGYVKPSIMLETILRSWTSNNQVECIDPVCLRGNTYYMWISLFGEKSSNSVFVETDLSPDIQYTFSKLFYEQFKVQLAIGSKILIKPFSPIMLQAIQNNRPIEESMELSYLLPLKEKDTIKTLVTEWEEERSNYAY